MKTCELSVIFNQILIHIYDPLQQNTPSEIQACIVSEGKALDEFWQSLPPHLRLEANDLPAFAPPSHIVTLKLVSPSIRPNTLFWRTDLDQLPLSHIQNTLVQTFAHEIFWRYAVLVCS
jgi:hypothetical protein